MKTIEVIVSPDGNVTVEAFGFKGKGCEAATKAIEQALGVSGKSMRKPEYNAPEHVQIGGCPKCRGAI